MPKITTAILQVSDTGPLESLIVMIRSLGIECLLPSSYLQKKLREYGLDTVLEVADLVRNWGYERPRFSLRQATEKDLCRDDILYVDVKAHRNGPKLWRHHPQLEKRTLWYRINGGYPEHVINSRGDHGNEVDPPCPVLTPNQWYSTIGPWHSKSYAFWPYFNGFERYYQTNKRVDEYPDFGRTHKYDDPICLIHNFSGWGYGALADNMRDLGVRIYGLGSPNGLLDHSKIPALMARTKAMVHLKSNDAPGYALYEALAARCPVICSRRLIWRCKMQDLLIPDKTCLVFDRETHEGLSIEDVRKCTIEINDHLIDLERVEYNREIGKAGADRLLSIMWDVKNPEHFNSFYKFMYRMFGV